MGHFFTHPSMGREVELGGDRGRARGTRQVQRCESDVKPARERLSAPAAASRQGENVIKPVITPITPGLAPLHRKAFEEKW